MSSHCRTSRSWRFLAASEKPQLVGETGARPAAEFQDDRQERPFQPTRLAGVGGHVGQSLAEDTHEEPTSQKKRLARTSSSTEMPCHGRSETPRD